MRQSSFKSQSDKLIDDEYRFYYQTKFMLLILGSVSLFMCILNIFTHKQLLMMYTGGFAVLSFINFAIVAVRKKLHLLNTIFLVLTLYVLFTYFIITGGTAGFSPHWILLLPAVACFMWGQRTGITCTGLYFIILAMLLWTNAGKELLQYEYSPEFCMRFPIVYVAFGAVGIMFEIIRLTTYKEMIRARAEVQRQAETDSLTGVHNRWWFNQQFEAHYSHKILSQDGLMLLLDIDHFKEFNDNYGHMTGDKVLVAVSQAIESSLRETDFFCRWGGEEFFAFLPDCPVSSAPDLCNRIRSNVANSEITSQNGDILHVTVSVGAVCIKGGQVVNPDMLFNMADAACMRLKPREEIAQ